LPISDAFSTVRRYLLRVVEDTNPQRVVEIQMFMEPTLVTMTIAATRMYRSLVNFYYTDEYVILSFQ
jgi:hypothetical protein